jgi:hypothetical protein
MEVYKNQDFKLTKIFSKNNLSEIEQNLKEGFLAGRSVYHLITSAMEDSANLKFNKEQGSFLIRGTPIPLNKSINLISFWFRGIVHQFKLNYNEEYKSKFEQTTHNLATVFINAQQLDKIETLQQRKEELDQHIRLLEEGIETLEKTRLPEKSSDIINLETKIENSKSKIKKLRTICGTMQQLKTLLAREDVFDKGITALTGFLKQKDIHLSTGYQDAKQKMIDDLRFQGILITKEQLDDHKKINTTEIEHEIASEQEAINSNEEVLNSLQEDYKKTRDEKDDELNNTIIELCNKIQILQGELDAVLNELKQFRIEDVEQTEEETKEAISSEEIEKAEETTDLPDGDAEFVDINPELSTPLSHLNDQERTFYATLTAEEQTMYATIANIEGENFSVVADLILVLTKGNNPSYTYEPESKILTVITSKQTSGAVGLVKITIPTQLNFEYDPIQKQLKILKGPAISGVTLYSLYYFV